MGLRMSYLGLLFAQSAISREDIAGIYYRLDVHVAIREAY